MFKLNDRLNKCIQIGTFPLSLLLLKNDRQFPWFILVPQQENLKEICDLSESDQIQLLKESSMLSKCIQQCFQPDKLNVASIGNVVSQLHVHHIARYQNDLVWPEPVWGKLKSIAYEKDKIIKIKHKIAEYQLIDLTPFS